jgi:hypothetical protein
VAGIDSLLKGVAQSFAKDTAGKILTPQQMELARFLINPQFYLAEQGINKLSNLMGYGQEVKQMQTDAKLNEDYFKQIMRDAAGDVLPDFIGNLIRATPKPSEADLQPAGVYIAFDPETQTYIQHESPNPIPRGGSAKFDDFLRELEIDVIPEVGPQEEYSQARLNDEYDFMNSISDFQSGLQDSAPATEPGLQDSAPATEPGLEDSAPATEPGLEDSDNSIDLSGTMDYSDLFSGGGGRDLEMYFGNDFGGFGGGGGGGGGGYFDYSSNAMAKGGQIRRGRR